MPMNKAHENQVIYPNNMESVKKYIMRILGAENTAKPKGTKIIVKPAIQSRVKSLTELAANQLERSIKRQAKLPEPGTSN